MMCWYFKCEDDRALQVEWCVRSAQRVALPEIIVDTLVSALTRRGRHERDRLV